MAKTSQVVGSIIFSLLLLVGLGVWVEMRDGSPEPDSLSLEETTELDGPLSPDELEVTKPAITNTMNRHAVFTTSLGTFTLELFEDVMPITTGNFIALAEDGFYNGIKFHRVIDGFMVQGGDPNSKGDDVATYGKGGPGYTIQDEFVNEDYLSNTRGTIAMANTGQPDSGGSQFFINTVDNVFLDFNKEPLTSKHPVFGRVIDGMDVVDTISKTDVEQNDLPATPVVVESVQIVEYTPKEDVASTTTPSE